MLFSFSIIVTLAAIFSFLNFKFFKLPDTIGLTIIALLFAAILYLSRYISPVLYDYFCNVIYQSDFNNLLFNGLLSFLLFAGALHINFRELANERWPVIIFATLGVLISTVIVGFGLYGLSILFGVEIPLVFCLLFGSLISPTDPIAVLSILKTTNVSKSLLLKVEGESLFNDGIGVVVFTAILTFVPSEMMMEEEIHYATEIGVIFLEEVVGGLTFGAALGFIGYYLINASCDNGKLVTLLTIGVVMGGYTIANSLHFSGPLAMVMSGLIIGNKIDINYDMDSPGKMALNQFWGTLDYLLNAVVFVLMGLAVHLIEFDTITLMLGIVTIFLVIGARYLSIASTYSIIKHEDDMSPSKTIKILTWGGLRGGISIALALSISGLKGAEPLLLITYIVVIFSVLVQGLTIGKLIKSLN